MILAVAALLLSHSVYIMIYKKKRLTFEFPAIFSRLSQTRAIHHLDGFCKRKVRRFFCTTLYLPLLDLAVLICCTMFQTSLWAVLFGLKHCSQQGMFWWPETGHKKAIKAEARRTEMEGIVYKLSVLLNY